MSALHTHIEARLEMVSIDLPASVSAEHTDTDVTEGHLM